MANRITRGTAIVGNLSSDIGFSAFAIASGIVITPNSAVPASGDLFATYTTGLAALSLATNDFIFGFHPHTNLASGLSVSYVHGATNGIKVKWQNGSPTAVTIDSTTWSFFAAKRTTKE